MPTQAETNVDCFSIGWYGSGVVPNSVTIYTTTKRIRDLQDLAAGAAMTLTEAGILAVWHQLGTAIVTDGSIGKQLKDNINAAISSRSSHDAAAVVTALEAAGTKLTLLEARLTAARALLLDNLNVGGLLASQADVAAITQAQRVRIALPSQMERPDADSTTYRVYIYAYDEQHKAEDLDDVPTVTVENNVGTDRSGNLGTVTKAAGTGIYYVDYTIASTHAIEGLVFKVTATEGSVGTQYAAAALVVDTTAVDFTSGDRSKLESIYGKLPSNNIAETGEYTENIASILENVLSGNATLAGVALLAAAMSKLQQADIKLDTTTTPWTEKYYEKGTATLLLTKVLYDENGNGITSIDSYIGRRMNA